MRQILAQDRFQCPDFLFVSDNHLLGELGEVIHPVFVHRLLLIQQGSYHSAQRADPFESANHVGRRARTSPRMHMDIVNQARKDAQSRLAICIGH